LLRLFSAISNDRLARLLPEKFSANPVFLNGFPHFVDALCRDLAYLRLTPSEKSWPLLT
jgi:hypothetical protein